MRIVVFAISAAFLACALSAVAQAQQQPDSQESLQELRLQVQKLAGSLEQTQGDLREAREEIRALRSELDQMHPAPANPPQEPSSSLPDRVALLEESQRVVESRLEQQQQTKVESASKYSVKLSGMVLFNAGLNRGTVNDQDVPGLAMPNTPGATGGSISATMRQTLLGLQVSGPGIAGAKTTGSLQFDFFGGFPEARDGSALGLVRLRVAKVQLDWDRWSLSFGQEQPFISPLSPTSLASLGTPALGYSGNLWTWTPQIALSRRWIASERNRAELQIGMLDPFDGETPAKQFLRQPEAGERSRVPAFAARQSWTHGIGEHAFTVGASGYFSKQDHGFGRTVEAWGGMLDWDIPLSRMVSLSGEFFRGQALGGLWGGIGTSVVYGGAQDLPSTPVFGVNTIGGWSQIKLRPSFHWEFNAAFGEDSPFAGELRHSAPESNYIPVMRNWTTMVNVIQRPRSNLLLSLEYRHLNTVQFDGSARTAEHINLGVGVQF